MKLINLIMSPWIIVLLWTILVHQSVAIDSFIDQIFEMPAVESNKLEATVFADPKDWITINKSFPTVEQQSWNEFRQDSRRFFYSLGRYEVGAHRLTNETITTLLEDYDRTPFNRLNFFFKIWYNQDGNKDVKCVRSYYVYDEKIELPLDRPEKWVEISRTIIINDRKELVKLAKKSLLTMSNLNGCEDSILALKEIRISYDHFDWSDLNNTMMIKELKQQTKSMFEISMGTKVDQLNLYKCKEQNCIFVYDSSIPPNQNTPEGVQLFHYHHSSNVDLFFKSQDKILEKTKDWDQKSDNNGYMVFLTPTGLEKIDKHPFTIEIEPKDDGIVAFNFEDKAVIPIVEATQFVLNENPTPDMVNNFIDNKNAPVYLWHKNETNNAIESATILHEQVDLSVDNSNPCLKIAYISDRPIKRMKIWLHINFEDDSIQELYNLHEHQQSNLTEETLRFCPTDFLYLDKLAKPSATTKGQLYIQLIDNDQSENLMFISVMNEQKPNEMKTEDSHHLPPFFFPISDPNYQVWSKSLMPIPDVDVERNGAELIMKKLKSFVKYSVFTEWLSYVDNDKLTLQPLILSLSSQVKEIRAKLCDVTSLCMESIKKTQEISAEKKYLFEFEPHPNLKSTHLNLRIEFITGEANELTIEVINFGNPCQPIPICAGINSKCDQSITVRANNMEDACSCEEGFDGNDCSQIDFCLEKECATGRCLNFKNDAKCQCDNEITDGIRIYDETEKKCIKQKDPETNKGTSKISDTSLIDLRLYDICVFIQNIPNEKQTVPLHKLKFQFDQEVLVEMEGIDRKQSYELCLSHYLNLTALNWEHQGQLILTLEQTDNSIIKFYNPPNDWQPPIRTINLKNHVHSVGVAIESYNITDKTIFFKSETNKQTILTTHWFENPYSISGELETDQTIRIEVGKPDRQQVCFAIDKIDCHEFLDIETLIGILKENSAHGFRFEWLYKNGIGNGHFEVSVFDPCWHGCSGYGNCIAIGLENYQCDCENGYYGKKCQLTKCSEENAEWCRKNIGRKSECVPLTEKEFECQCPIGYQFDSKSDPPSCRRINTKRKSKICGTTIADETNPQCFLQNLAQKMKYLPGNFPQIDPSLFKYNQPSIYFTGKSGSHIKIDDISLSKDDKNDICLSFRYFLAGQNARLNLTMMSNGENEQNLFQIEGIKMLKHTKEIIHDDRRSVMSFSSDMEKLCIKEMIDLKQIEELKSLTIVTTFDHQSNDLTLIQIHGIETQPIAQRITTEPWFYISRTKSGLKQLLNSNDDITEKIAKSDWWPFKFPNRRWEDKKVDDNDEPMIISLISQHSDTTGFAQLESQWLQQAINKPTTMTIKLNSMKPNNLQHVHIILFNQQRQPLYDVGTYRVFIKEDVKDNEDKQDIIVLGEKKVISVPQLNINNETLYKVVIQFYFDDPASSVNKPFLFELMDFAFNDPCIHEDGKNQECFNLKDQHDPTIKCLRDVSSRSKIDYQCDCDFENGAKGRNCEDKNYCKFRHQDYDKKKINGIKYCAIGDGECHEGRFKRYNFFCECKNNSLWFQMEEKKCLPVQQCLLDMPGQLERRKCHEDETNEKCLCKCKTGYKVDPNDPNQCVVNDSDKCDPGFCPDERMFCVRQGSQQLCKCPQGFKFDGQKCKSDLCLFPSMNPCQQKCKPKDEEPYFQCECIEQYYTAIIVTDPTTNVSYTKCELRKDVPEPCQQCTGPNQLCVDGQCQCREGFEAKRSSSDQIECIIKDLKMACPNNKLHVDSLTNRIVCECTDKDLTDWWQQLDNGSCGLVKTACDENEQGDLTCRRYGALCVLKSDHPDSFECLCPHGYMFVDETQSKEDSFLMKNQLSGCHPVCELPYYDQLCSAIGGRCNPSKLWPLLYDHTPKDKIKSNYCDCLPGMFPDNDNDGYFCRQESNVTAYRMLHTWTVELQNEFENRMDEFNKLLGRFFNYSKILETSLNNNRLDYIDPINWAKAQVRSLKINEERIQNKRNEWNALIKEQVLREQVRIMMANFGVVEREFQLDLVRMDSEQIENNSTSANQYQVMIYGRDVNTDKKIKCLNHDNWCLIPYLQMAFETKIESFEPCSQVNVCQGMSDCHESKGYFSCECNPEYFVVEKSYPLKTNDPSAISKNERCLSKALCGNCTDDNQQCFEMDPVRSKDDKSKWLKERLCECQPGYRRDSEQEPCVSVCQPDTCGSGGECLPIGNDYKCHCDSEHYGERCENEFASNVGWIVAIVILSLVVVGAIAGLAYVLLFKNRTNRS